MIRKTFAYTVVAAACATSGLGSFILVTKGVDILANRFIK